MTAIEQLIEKIDFCILYYQNEISLNYHAPTIVEIMQGKISELEKVKDMTNRMLPIEKQQIVDAAADPFLGSRPECDAKQIGENYYKTTFNK